MKHSRTKPRSAFTLVELAMVLTITAILCAMAMPRYTASLTRYRADSAARRLAADLAAARTRARTTNTSVAVTFTLSTSSYQITGLKDLATSSANLTTTLSKAPYVATLTSVTFPSNTVTFNRFGTPDNGGTVVVQSGSVQKTITLDSNTGSTTVQ